MGFRYQERFTLCYLGPKASVLGYLDSYRSWRRYKGCGSKLSAAVLQRCLRFVGSKSFNHLTLFKGHSEVTSCRKGKNPKLDLNRHICRNNRFSLRSRQAIYYDSFCCLFRQWQNGFIGENGILGGCILKRSGRTICHRQDKCFGGSTWKAFRIT